MFYIDDLASVKGETYWLRIAGNQKGFCDRLTLHVMIVCAVLYIISFAQIMLPISASTKTILWIVFFGLAKIAQYIGLAIVGAEGWRRIKAAIKRTKEGDEEKKTTKD